MVGCPPGLAAGAAIGAAAAGAVGAGVGKLTGKTITAVRKIGTAGKTPFQKMVVTIVLILY